MTPEFMAAVLASRLAEAQKLLGAELPAEPVDEAVERFLARRVAQLREEPEVQRWLARAIVRREGGRSMIGNVGFHGQPGVNAAGSERALEIGYGIPRSPSALSADRTQRLEKESPAKHSCLTSNRSR